MLPTPACRKLSGRRSVVATSAATSTLGFNGILAFHVTSAMDQKRAQTYAIFMENLTNFSSMSCSLEALENFILSHKTLLERTYADIERLTDLRRDVGNNLSLSLEQLSGKVGFTLLHGLPY